MKVSVFSRRLKGTIYRDLLGFDSIQGAVNDLGDAAVLALMQSGLRRLLRDFVGKSDATTLADMQTALNNLDIDEAATATRTRSTGAKGLDKLTNKINALSPADREAFKAKLRAEGLI